MINNGVEYISFHRKKKSLDEYYNTLSHEQLSSITAVSMDMWDPQLFRNVGTCSGLMPIDSRISFCFLVISVVISFPACSMTFLSLCNSSSIFSTEYFFSRPDDLVYSRILGLMAIAMRFTNVSPLNASMP